jgi:predicted RNase H-like HicB family nuclease
MYYPATFIPHRDGSGIYDVAFVDIPGCYSQGDNIEHALEMAREALTLHLSTMIEDGDPLPPPSSLEEARRNEEAQASADGDDLPEGTLYQYVVVDISVPAKKTASVHVSISLKPAILESIDAMAEEMGLTRSGVIAVATRDYINRMRT